MQNMPLESSLDAWNPEEPLSIGTAPSAAGHLALPTREHCSSPPLAAPSLFLCADVGPAEVVTVQPPGSSCGVKSEKPGAGTENTLTRMLHGSGAVARLGGYFRCFSATRNGMNDAGECQHHRSVVCRSKLHTHLNYFSRAGSVRHAEVVARQLPCVRAVSAPRPAARFPVWDCGGTALKSYGCYRFSGGSHRSQGPCGTAHESPAIPKVNRIVLSNTPRVRICSGGRKRTPAYPAAVQISE